jgi:hypothetical protein
MSSETTPKANSATSVAGPAPMYWDVIEVAPIGNLDLQVRFADGLTGRVRFLPAHLTGVFAPLKDRAFFERVFVDHGAVAWPGDIDLAPDAMYHAIKRDGEWVLA